jgi:hypothetical protein
MTHITGREYHVSCGCRSYLTTSKIKAELMAFWFGIVTWQKITVTSWARYR